MIIIELLNLLFSFVFSYADVYLLDYCLKLTLEKEEGIEKKKFNIIVLISTVLFFIALHFPPLYLICLFAEIYLIFNQYYKFKTSLGYTIKISIIKLLIDILCILLFEWLFEIILFSKYRDELFALKILCSFTSKYIQCFIFVLYYQKINRINAKDIRYFKTFSFILSILFGLCITTHVKSLFYISGIGKTMIFTLVIYNVILIIFDRYQIKHDEIEREYAEKRKEYEMIALKHKMQEEYNEKIQEEQDNIRNIKHNIKNYLYSIYGYIEKGENKEAMEQIDGILHRMKSGQFTNYTGHIGIDSILDEKIALAKSKNIKVKEDFRMVDPGIVDSSDLAIVLGSTLDNAIEAIERIEEDIEKELSIKIFCNNSYLVMSIRNTVTDGYNIDFDHTSKITEEKDHGYGVKDIKAIATKYDGSACYNVTETYVEVNIMLYAYDD